MPTPEEIKKLAEQYAEFTDGSPADKAYIRAITQCFLEWLSKDYCIVPKDIVIKAYESTYPNDIDQGLSGIMQAAMLREIFGKELFENIE